VKSAPDPEADASGAATLARPTARRRGPAPAHTRGDIAAVAVALADKDGLPALSMRAVATALGTGAGSLYRYVASRDELLNLMNDHVLGELRPYPLIVEPWMDAVLLVGRRQLELYRRHPWLLDVIEQSTDFGPEALAWLDHCLHVLEPVDRTSTAKLEAIAMMTGVTTLFARRSRTPGRALPSFDPGAYPHLTAAMVSPPTPAVPHRDLYERTVRSLLTGLLT
jgi:AcrR family transcriptional regulator